MQPQFSFSPFRNSNGSRAMGKKGSSKKAPNVASGSQPLSLREESIGKRHTNVNAKSMLKLDHLKNLAVWSSGEASIPPLAAFFGHHLATSTEAVGPPPDPSLFTCERCESVLQPGYNCTIRIEKNKRKVRSRRKKSTPGPQNNVVYNCYFCSHQNLLKGTPKDHMKEICPPKPKALQRREPIEATAQKSEGSFREEPIKATTQKSKRETKHHENNVEITKMGKVASSEILKDDSITNSPAISSVTPVLTLLESKIKKRNRSSAKKAFASESSFSAVTNAGNIVSSSNKQRRKSWTSLKEIAESSGNDGGRKLTDLTIPFSL